jgi:hypothetical protein
MGLDCLAPVIAVLLALLMTAAIDAWAGAEDAPPGDGQGGGKPAADSCKSYGGGPCCDRQIARHLSRYAVFTACRETGETYLGERGGKDSCRYVFRDKNAGKAGDAAAAAAALTGSGEGFVEIQAPAQAQVPEQPEDPFFSWMKVGKAFVTTRARTPDAQAVLASATGIWLPGDGYFVSVTASTRVCTRGEAQQLARSVR